MIALAVAAAILIYHERHRQSQGATPTGGAASTNGGRYVMYNGQKYQLHLHPDGGAAIAPVAERADPLFQQRLATASLERLRQGVRGKLYPYIKNGYVHDIGFPYVGAPLSHVVYPVGSSPANGKWYPIGA